MEQFIPVYIILPLGMGFLIPLFGKKLNTFSKVISPLVYLMLVILSGAYIYYAPKVPTTYSMGGWGPVDNVPIAIYLVLDGLSAFVICIINLIAFLSAVYAISYMKKYTAQNNFYTLLALMAAGMNGVVLTGDLFNLYVFLEIASVASYALVAFGVKKEELEASFKYQVLGGMASLIILLGIGLIYWTTSTLNIADISKVLTAKGYNGITWFIQLLLLAGFGLKAAIVPFHAWLPDAHSSAPSPISSMLSGVLIKAIGVYVIIRLFFNMFLPSQEVGLIIILLGTLSMIVGGIMAIGQWDYKRLLAYSSISQVGYIIIALGIALSIIANNGDMKIASLALFGALFHLINHAVFKGLLFMAAGAVEHATGIRDLTKIEGLGKQLPVTSVTSFCGSLAISGVPPFSGFFSKLIIIIAAIYAQLYVLAFLAAAMSIVTLAYFLKFYKNIFTSHSKSVKEFVKKTPLLMKFSMIVLAMLSLILSVLIIPGVREVIIMPAINILLDSSIYMVNIIGS